MTISFLSSTFVAADASSPAITPLTGSRGVVFWQDTSDFKVRGRVVDVAAGDIDLGLTQMVINAAVSSLVPVRVDDTHFLICWGVGSTVYARVFEVDGAFITGVGTATTVYAAVSGNAGVLSLARDGVSTNHMLFFNIGGGEGYAAVILAATSSGVSAFTPEFFMTGDVYGGGLEFIASNRAVVIYSDSSSRQMYARILDNAAGTITAGAEQTLTGLESGGGDMVALSSQKLLVSGVDLDDLFLQLLQVVGTTISALGSATALGSAFETNSPSVFKLSAERVFTAYGNSGGNGVGGYFDISGSTITPDDSGVFENTANVGQTYARATSSYGMIAYRLPGTSEVWLALTGLGKLEFWHGTANTGLTKRADLTFGSISNPDCLLVDSQGNAYVGSGEPGVVMIEKLSPADGYSTPVDITGSLSQERPIKAVRGT